VRRPYLFISMHDSELKKLLLETCPVRPGQESRAWSALRDRLYSAQSARSGSRPLWSRLYRPSWRGLGAAAAVIALISILGDFYAAQPVPLATADSQSPGIYATSFYSRSAQAQVVWLTGMEPASDKPTYLDPTTITGGRTETQQPAADPNSL
jgi:hypothetical protein